MTEPVKYDPLENLARSHTAKVMRGLIATSPFTPEEREELRGFTFAVVYTVIKNLNYEGRLK